MKKKLTQEELYRKAFKDARADLEETNQENIEAKAQEIAEKRLLSLLTSVDLSKVVTINKLQGLLFVGGIKAEPGQLANLKAEAEFLSKSELWQLLQHTPKELAQQTLFKNSESLDDLKKGKAMLYTLDAQQNIVNVLLSYNPK